MLLIVTLFVLGRVYAIIDNFLLRCQNLFDLNVYGIEQLASLVQMRRRILPVPENYSEGKIFSLGRYK